MLVALGSAVLGSAFAPAAGAEPYCSSGHCLRVWGRDVAHGRVRLIINGVNFAAGGSVRVSVTGARPPVRTIAVPATGDFRATVVTDEEPHPIVTVVEPATSTTLRRTYLDSGRSAVLDPKAPASADTTSPASGSTTDAAAYTGVAIVGLGAVGLVLVTGGILLLVIGRRRNRGR